MDFVIQPIFYQRVWFEPLCAATAACGLYLAWRLRVHRVHREYATILAERVRMGRDLHDTLLQGLFGMSLQLDAIVTQLEMSPPRTIKERILHIRSQIEQCLHETRHSIWNLRSPFLATHDLPTALRSVEANLTAVGQAQFDLVVIGRPRWHDSRIEDQLFRISEEAMTNAVRHSNATHVRVEICYEEASIRLMIADDGHGFDTTEPGDDHIAGFGLINMRERAAQIGGRLDVLTSPTHGTTITVVVEGRSDIAAQWPFSWRGFRRRFRAARSLSHIWSSRH